MRRIGRPKKKGKDKLVSLTIGVSKDTKNKLREIAKISNESVSHYIQKMIKNNIWEGENEPN